MENETFLSQIPLFKDFCGRHLHELALIAHEQSFQKNEVICRLREPESSLYVVKEGTVKVSAQDRSSREVILYVVQPGEFFGETSLFVKDHQLGVATALRPCQVLAISRDWFVGFLDKHPRVLFRVLSTLSIRLNKAEQRISRLVFADAYEKVASALTDTLEEMKAPIDAGVEVALPLSHKELASLVGVSRETFTRIMTVFQKAGLIRVASRRVAIVNPRRLKHEATRSGYV